MIHNTTDTNTFAELGQAGCDVGLQYNGKFLYLVGVGLVKPDVPTNSSLPTHNCIISSNVKILFPIVNTACNSRFVNTINLVSDMSYLVINLQVILLFCKDCHC
jgi:hypothetical protein